MKLLAFHPTPQLKARSLDILLIGSHDNILLSFQHFPGYCYNYNIFSVNPGYIQVHLSSYPHKETHHSTPQHID